LLEETLLQDASATEKSKAEIQLNFRTVLPPDKRPQLEVCNPQWELRFRSS